MDAEVSRTLAELERKLRELERVLSVEAGRQSHEAGGRPETGLPREDLSAHRHSDEVAESQPHARLVDESVAIGEDLPPPRPRSSDPDASAWERGGSDQAPSAAAPRPLSEPAQESPSTAEQPPRDEVIELQQLVHFRERLQSTMQQLIDEYTAIITLRKSSERTDQHGQSRHP